MVQKSRALHYDFVSAKTHDGSTVRMLNLIDEDSREYLMISKARFNQLKIQAR